MIIKCPDCGYEKEKESDFNLCPYHDYTIHMVSKELPKPVFLLRKVKK